MTDLRKLEALQALHAELVAVRQHRFEGLQVLETLLEEQTDAFRALIAKPARDTKDREALGKGKRSHFLPESDRQWTQE